MRCADRLPPLRGRLPSRSWLLFLLLAAVAFSALALLSPEVLASGDDLKKQFVSVHGRLATLFTWIRNVLFLVAGVAVIAVAASAYAGRFNIKWFVTVVISVVLIAVNGALTNYFVNTSAGSAGTSVTTPGSMDDALR